MSDELGARCSPTIWSMTDGAQGAESKELDRGEGSVLAEQLMVLALGIGLLPKGAPT